MNVTIETINGREYTVVWKGAPEKHSRNIQQECVAYAQWMGGEDGTLYAAVNKKIVATALPALPRFPELKDAELIYLYAANGLFPVFEFLNGEQSQIRGLSDENTFYTECTKTEIAYGMAGYRDNRGIVFAKDRKGNSVNIAIED